MNNTLFTGSKIQIQSAPHIIHISLGSFNKFLQQTHWAWGLCSVWTVQGRVPQLYYYKNTLGEKSNLIHVGVWAQIRWDLHELQISPASETSQNHAWRREGQRQQPVISQNRKIADWHILPFLHYDLYWIRSSSKIQSTPSYPILKHDIKIKGMQQINKLIDSMWIF